MTDKVDLTKPFRFCGTDQTALQSVANSSLFRKEAGTSSKLNSMDVPIEKVLPKPFRFCGTSSKSDTTDATIEKISPKPYRFFAEPVQNQIPQISLLENFCQNLLN